MIDFSDFYSSFINFFSIESLDIFSITYSNSLKSFIDDTIRAFPNIKINIYFNLNKYFKDFIYTNNIFNKLLYINNIQNIKLNLTKSVDKVIIINRNINNTFSLDELKKTISINSNFDNCEIFDLRLLANLYKLYVLSKKKLFDFEFEKYYKQNNYIILDAKNVPQFSSFEHAHTISTEIIASKDSITYIELGKLLNINGKNNEGAQKKYGENHGKFSNLLDFSYINIGHNKSFSPTPLGKIYLTLYENERDTLLKFQLYKLYITQIIMTNNIYTKTELIELLSSTLSLSTAKRRLSNVNSILRHLELLK